MSTIDEILQLQNLNAENEVEKSVIKVLLEIKKDFALEEMIELFSKLIYYGVTGDRQMDSRDIQCTLSNFIEDYLEVYETGVINERVVDLKASISELETSSLDETLEDL